MTAAAESGTRLPRLDRADCLYTAQFCEENVWHLLRRIASTAAQAAAHTVGHGERHAGAIASPPSSSSSITAGHGGWAGDVTRLPGRGSRSLSTSPLASSPMAALAAAGGLDLYAVFITNPNRQVRVGGRGPRMCVQRTASPHVPQARPSQRGRATAHR